MKQPSKLLRIGLPLIIVFIWFVGAGIGGPFFGKISEVSSVDLTAFLPKSSEAAKASTESKKFVDQSIQTSVIVFEATDDGISKSDEKAIDSVRHDLEKVDGVKGDVSPVTISDDKKAAIVSVVSDSDKKIREVRDDMHATLKRADLANTKAYITGPGGFASDLNKAFSGIDGILLGVALAVVFVILLVVYRSPLLPFIVLMTSMFALAVSVLVVWWLAKQDVVTINGQIQGILFILVIGAATDYSLLYVSRYREELHKYSHRWDATLSAWKASFEPILASGGTVIAGLMCLIVSDLTSNSALGPVGSVGIVLAILSALTFLPALLAMFGRAAFWPFRPKYEPARQNADAASFHKGFWSRAGKFVARYPRWIWITSTLLLLAGVSGIFQLKADGVAQSDLILGYSEARAGQEVLDKHFPNGSGTPVLVVTAKDSQDKVVAAIDKDKGIDSVSATAVNSPSKMKPVGEKEAEIKQEIRKAIETQMMMPGQGMPAGMAMGASSVDSLVENAYPFKEAKVKVVNGNVLLQATMVDSPDSEAAKATVKRLRDEVHRIDSGAYVGGITASQLDSNTASIHDRSIIIPLVLVVITLILMVLLRSIVAPLILLVSTVLSFTTTLGISSYLFNDIWNFPGADPSVVLYGFVFLVALGIDYNIFLMTRVREESLKLGARRGVITGLVVTGGVITSAGVVLASTFAALSVIPILVLAQLAFVVAFGVLLDTIIIRSLLVPAVIYDLGKRAWWPSKIKK